MDEDDIIEGVLTPMKMTMKMNILYLAEKSDNRKLE